jgi:hypothetical protein
VTAVEALELTTQGGATDFARLIQACQSFGSYCLIGGLAINCYVEPVYTLDADIVVKMEEHQHSLNVRPPRSDLRIQFTADERYQAFLTRCVDGDVLELRVKVASLEDVAQSKLWVYGDPRRRLSMRKKDELDLIRLAEADPALKSLYPSELIEQIDRG